MHGRLPELSNEWRRFGPIAAATDAIDFEIDQASARRNNTTRVYALGIRTPSWPNPHNQPELACSSVTIT